MTDKEFTKVANKLIRCKGISNSLFRFISVVASYNPSFPSRRKISSMAPLSDGNITNCLREAQEFNLLSYVRGGDQRSNHYTIKPVSEWKLPTNLGPSKLKGTSKSKKGPLKNEVRPQSEFEGGVPQNLRRNKNNRNNTKIKNHNKEEQDSNSKKDFTSNSLDNRALKNFGDELLDHYQRFSQEYFRVRYPKRLENQFTCITLLSATLDRSIELSGIGGTLHGLVRNEFVRLRGQRKPRLAELRFLTEYDASFNSYAAKICNEVEDECDLNDVIFPLSGRHLKGTTERDGAYSIAVKSVKTFLECGSIGDYEQYRIAIGRHELKQIGMYLFKYLLLKEFVVWGCPGEITIAGLKLYKGLIGSSYWPLSSRTLSKDAVGWPEYGINKAEFLKPQIEFEMRRPNHKIHFDQILNFKVPQDLNALKSRSQTESEPFQRKSGMKPTTSSASQTAGQIRRTRERLIGPEMSTEETTA